MLGSLAPILALTLAGCATVMDRTSETAETLDTKPEPLAPAGKASNPWAGRSGETEALADIAKGLPIKLFYQSIAGEREYIRTPGLRNCNPDRFDVPEDERSKFVPVGADFSESILYTDEERARYTSATLFARAYNVTMFTKKRDEVLKICPATTRE